MKFLPFFVIMLVMPGLCDAAPRSNTAARRGMITANMGSRAPNKAKASEDKAKAAKDVVTEDEDADDDAEDVEVSSKSAGTDKKSSKKTTKDKEACRDAYRECMDDFCLLDESEGNRCACSNNISASKSLIKEIQQIQSEADKLYTEGVEREQLGAKAAYVFGESEQAKKSSRASGLSFAQWLNSDSGASDSLDEDSDIGEGLYSMASDSCADVLEECGDKAEMEELLYSRMIIQDCKGFESYLQEQKRNAEANKRTAEKAVRTARVEMMNETQKYNRGECLLAYKNCIADKGGCGSNFENCLDKDLLGRRAHACDNILDNCTAVKKYVLEDWEKEAEYTLQQAAVYSDRNYRLTCNARIQACLEDGCSTSTNAACLTNVNVAAGICPVIDECDEKIPGLKESVNSQLGFLRVRFCQNDVDKCLHEKCGENFTDPACLGKSVQDIVALCPQKMFPSCKGETQFDIIVSSAMMQMDYKKLQGCLNYFSEELGKVCGTDMTCLPTDTMITSLKAEPKDLSQFREDVRASVSKSVSEFFKKFESDKTIKACESSEGANLGTVVFNNARMIAEYAATNRAMRDLDAKLGEIVRVKDLKEAEKKCTTMYKPESPKKSQKNITYIRSVNFEPKLHNCHVCRMQRVCETGGESKASSALKAAAGGLSAGASAGTMVSPGWGTAIGGVIGAVGAGAMGFASGGKEDYCQEIESCEDINIEVISG